MPSRLSHSPLDTSSSLVRHPSYLHHPQLYSFNTQPTTSTQLCFPAFSSTSTPPFMSPPMSPPVNHFRFPPQGVFQSATPAYSAQQSEPKQIKSRLASHSPATTTSHQQTADLKAAAAGSQGNFFTGFLSGPMSTSDAR